MRTSAIAKNRLRILLLALLSFLLLSPFVIRKQQAAPVVTVTEFSDFQCPYCKHAAGVVEQLRQSYGKNVKLVFKQMPLPMHQHAFKAAQASVCAREQGRFWEYHDRLFAASDLSADALNRIGAEVGLNPDEFSQCLESPTSRAIVEKDMAEAERLGVSGTPTFFVDGKVVRGAATFAALKQEIDGAMTKVNHAALGSSNQTEDTLKMRNVAADLRVGPAQAASDNGPGSEAQVPPTQLTNPAIKERQQASAATTGSGATLSINDVTLAEDSCQNKSFVFTVTLSKLANKVVTVRYATSDGSPDQSGTPAIANRDYVPASGTLSFTHDTAIEGPQGTYLLKITILLGNYVVSTGANDGRVFAVTLSGATNATISKSQGLGTMLNAALSCAAGTSCFVNYCGASRSCKQVDVSSCSLPGIEANCKLSSSCNTGDSEGDGLSDAWERAGGIDFNCDGELTPDEMVLTNVDPVFPDGTSNPHPSADPNVKDVFVKYDWMELPDQLTGGQPTACSVNPLPFPQNLFYPFHSDSCDWDQLCQGGLCRGHSDAPDPAALKMVIDAFAAHNIRLHLLKGHALPHANVLTYVPPVAACTADLSTQTFLGAQAVNFYDLKTENFFATYNGQTFNEAHLYPFFHYAVFGHRHSCDSTNDCQKPACFNVDTGANPLFNETGLAEKPGNDIIVSMGGFADRAITPPTLAQGGTFMHELGHNLGLDHGGPLYIGGQPTDYNQVHLNFKPNYLSVMNYNHQTLGISTADPNCAPSDYVCKTTPVSTRLDYSSFAGGVVPNTLDENSGNESAGLNLGNSDIGYTWCPSQTRIPGTGPVDFNCNGSNAETWCAVGCDFTFGFELNHDPAGGGKVPDGTPGSGDVLQPFEDWPNLYFFFQCAVATFND